VNKFRYRLAIPAQRVDTQCRTDDTLDQTDAEAPYARLARYADEYDIPVLITRNERNEFTTTAADYHLKCEQTRMGPRIIGEGFETLVYPVGDGAY
jgi:hypothetical protein